MDPASADALVAALQSFDADAAADVAVLWGEGGAFCAGWDLKYASSLKGDKPLASLDFPTDGGKPPRGPLGPTRLELSKPVIAAMEGPAVAGGMELALWCDVAASHVIGVLLSECGERGTIGIARFNPNNRSAKGSKQSK